MEIEGLKSIPSISFVSAFFIIATNGFYPNIGMSTKA